jgi:hypothetical protein
MSMAEEQKPSTTEIEGLKKELADIKHDMMRQELEDIKREKMRQELEEIKAEQAQKQQVYYERYVPRLSIITVIMATATLLAAGYILGMLYPFNLVSEVDKYLVGYGLPIGASLLLTIVSVVLFFIGMGLVTMAKR